MSTSSQGDVSSDAAPGVIIGSMPRHGERAALIRNLATRYPELSHPAIAQRVGSSPQNVDQVLSKFLGDNSLDDLRAFQGNETDILDAVRMRTVASITQDKLDKANALQLITGAAILMDKSRLLQGQPTSIHVTALVDLVQVLRERRNEQE